MSCSINQQWSYLISELRYFAFVTPPIYRNALFKLINLRYAKTVHGIFPVDGIAQKIIKVRVLFTGVNYLDNFIGVINTAFPCRRSPTAMPPTGGYRPAKVVRVQVRVRLSYCQLARALFRRQRVSAVPIKLTLPVRVRRSTAISMMSLSRSLPIGPPASASGDTWPKQAPVDTPRSAHR